MLRVTSQVSSVSTQAYISISTWVRIRSLVVCACLDEASYLGFQLLIAQLTRVLKYVFRRFRIRIGYLEYVSWLRSWVCKAVAYFDGHFCICRFALLFELLLLAFLPVRFLVLHLWLSNLLLCLNQLIRRECSKYVSCTPMISSAFYS